MKSFAFFCLLLLCARALEGAEWYVSPKGDDAAAGSIEQPFATILRAQQGVAPGDVVYLRGGTYLMKEPNYPRRKGIFELVIPLRKSGQPGKPITYRAYENEKPVFDFSQLKPDGMRITAFHVVGSWLHLIGIEVTGVQVTMKGHTQSICFESQGSHNIFERLSMHDGQAIGIYHVRGSENLFLNCDAWNNWDYTSEDGRGGNVDGFGCHSSKGSVGNIFRGCRAWFNSDDGYDCLGASEPVIFENCWAMYNGWSPMFEARADGNGFKAGGYGSTPVERMPKVIPRHVVRGCVAVGNKANGFYSNHHLGGSDWLNNSAYRNSSNFNMLCRLADNQTDVDGFGHKLMNNLSYRSRRDLVKVEVEKCDLANNSFTRGMKLSQKDFESLDEAELVQARQANGDLPVVRFLRPVEGSALVDAGIEVGLPFRGAKPDIGAIER